MPLIASPTPAQSLVERIGLPDGPLTLLIEDATGSGKTEAALVFAQRLIAAGRADGLFIALPTMATADAMYARLADSYRALFDPHAAPSLALAHGRAGLNTAFQGSVLQNAPPTNDVGDDAGETASAQCSAWIGEERRRTFLADVGVGTIDQALLGVLPSRHAALRLFGLSRRVLIVDEAHSYDAYVGSELNRLLAFQRMLGGSSIVLSATLPRGRRASLLDAKIEALDSQTGEAYPLLSLASAAGVREHRADMRAELVRCVPVRRVDSAAAAVGYLAAAARLGACGVWIRNTVADAIAGADLLRGAGISPMLFHARFAMGDRLDIQSRVLHAFGRHSTAADRAPDGMGRILVATQVVEQSLDLDFDVMVSDLAPVDLLIQRAGRLRRHPGRPRASATPPLALLVVSPEPVAQPGSGWAADPAIGGSRFVYVPHVLWRSARVLFADGSIDVPGNLRRLIEAVYGDAAEAVPTGLQQAESRADGERISQEAAARANLLAPELGYCRQNGQWEPDTIMPTRLGADDRIFRLAREVAGELVPFCPDADAARAWSLSEIALRRSMAESAVMPGRLQQALTRLLAGWSKWQREIPVLVMTTSDPDCLSWETRVSNRTGEATRRYSRDSGMQT